MIFVVKLMLSCKKNRKDLNLVDIRSIVWGILYWLVR